MKLGKHIEKKKIMTHAFISWPLGAKKEYPKLHLLPKSFYEQNFTYELN